MSPGLKMHEKQILSDPVAVFTSLHPDTDGNKSTALAELWQQAQTLKRQRKEIQTQAKVISSQIGEAKRNNQPVDGLKASMQEQSTQLKSLADQLGGIEKRILHFFESSNGEALPQTERSELPAGRNYTASIDNADSIVVSLLGNEENEWNAYVSKQPATTIHHRAEWRELLQETYGHEGFYYVARGNDGRIVGILPLIRLKSRLFGDFLVSMPYFQRGGAIADHPSIEQKLMQTANEHAATLGVDHIEYRDNIPREALPVQSHKVNMILALPDYREKLWKGFTSKLRAQIRRPQRENPQILFGGKEYLDDFYSVYARNMRDLGSPSHSKQFVQNILDCFQENSWIIVLRLNKQPVSAGLLIGDSNTLEIPLASTIRDVNPLSMNMLLYWEVLKFAIDQDFRYFDFGRSSKEAGTFRFKQQWGAEPRQLYWHYWLNGNVELPSLNPHNPSYALAIKIWKRLPLIVTRCLGPSIVKNLP